MTAGIGILRCQGSQTPLQVWNGPIHIHDAATTWILIWGAIASFFFFFLFPFPPLSFFSLPSRALPFACPVIANFPSKSTLLCCPRVLITQISSVHNFDLSFVLIVISGGRLSPKMLQKVYVTYNQVCALGLHETCDVLLCKPQFVLAGLNCKCLRGPDLPTPNSFKLSSNTLGLLVGPQAMSIFC